VWKLKDYIVIGLALILTSCGASWHLKRAIAKDPTIAQEEVVKIDTTVIVEEKVLEASSTITTDTVIVFEQSGVKTKIKVLHDTIMVQTICPPDTISIKQEVFVPKLVYKDKFSNFDLVKLVILVIVILIIITFLKKVFN
jgi:hypothetical protein